MRKLKTVIIFFHCFCFLGCQADSGPKKHSRLTKKLAKKSVVSYNPAVDVLFVIDDSGSMESVQHLLAKNSAIFIDEFLDTEIIDYHIAVTASSSALYLQAVPPGSKKVHPDTQTSHVPVQNASSRIYGGVLKRCKKLSEEHHIYSNYVDRHTPEGAGCLSEMMKVGTSSPGPEEFFNIPFSALSGKMLVKNFAFYRPEAHLAVFVITDSYDQSGLTPQESYLSLLKLKKGEEKKIHYAAGVITTEMLQYECDQEESPPSNIIEMVKLVGDRGYYFNLCQYNYGKGLAHFANHLVDSVLSIPLDPLPDVKTIAVRYDYKGGSQWIPKGFGGWTYDVDNNTIHLSRNIKLEKTGGEFSIQYELFYMPEPVDL